MSSRRVYFKERIAWEEVQAIAQIEYVLYDVLIRIYVNANRNVRALRSEIFVADKAK